MKEEFAPICLFTYNRLEETRRTVDALRRNFLATKSNLFVFSDGPKNEQAILKVNSVRDYLHSISGFKSVTVFESDRNRGLANSIIDGVSKIVKQYGKVIVVEDDLLSTPDFLNFMNQALDFYKDNDRIFSISGYTLDLPFLKYYDRDFYYAYRASSWGWGTWADRWEAVDWSAHGYKKYIFNPFNHFSFMRGGSDMPYMLWKQMNGKIDSWAIRWCFSQYINNMLTIYPAESKIKSIGFGSDATHTRSPGRFKTNLSTNQKVNYEFAKNIVLERRLLKEFRQKFSVLSRIGDKIIRKK